MEVTGRSARDGATAAIDERAIQLAGSLDCHLLADHGSHCDFERIPAAKHPNAGMGRDKRLHRGIAAEMCSDRGQVGVKIEHASDTLDGGIQHLTLSPCTVTTSPPLPWSDEMSSVPL